MLSIAVCDDEILIQHTLIKKLHNYLNQKQLDGEITGFLRGEELLDNGRRFDIVLLDIELNSYTAGLNGMQTAAALRERGNECEIIFVTSHSSYVYDAFNVDAAHFLVKPVADGKLWAAMDKVVRRVLKRSDSAFLLVKKGGSLLKIHFDDILYCEAVNHKLMIHTNGGVVDSYENIAAVAKKLDRHFFCCHRSFIINLKRVAAREKDLVIMDNGERAMVARRRSGELSKRLLEVIRREAIMAEDG